MFLYCNVIVSMFLFDMMYTDFAYKIVYMVYCPFDVLFVRMWRNWYDWLNSIGRINIVVPGTKY